MGDREEVTTKVVSIEDAMKHYSAEGQQRKLPRFDESAHDLLQMSLGQVLPGETAKVTVDMIKLLEIEDEYYMFRLPTSYFARLEVEPFTKDGVEYLKYHLRKPAFAYKYNVFLH